MTMCRSRVERNQIHALLGENGAGKSTLVKMIYGVVKPDAGDIVWEGRHVTIPNPGHAQRLGIGMVFQHFSLFEALTVTDNIALGLASAAERVGLRDRIVRISTEYGLPLDPDRVVHDLSVGERQRIEIVRCLLQNPKLLIMDEPTSVLTPSEVQKLFVTLRRLAHEGCSILYISHKLEEVRALCSAATIMRLGKNVATCAPAEKTVKELAEIMINMDLHAPTPRPHLAGDAAVRLVLDKLTLRSPDQFGTDLKDVSLSLAGGEILGIAGIAGNGQSELMDALSGEVLAGRPETVLIDGVAAGHMGPIERRRIGGCFVPEERNGHGAVTTMSLAENGFLSGYLREALVRFGVINAKRNRRLRGQHHQALRRADNRREGRGAVAVRRQPAEVPGRTGSAAEPQRADHQPADLGRRRGRRAGDPRGHHGAGPGRRRSDDHLAGSRRDFRPGRPGRGDRRWPHLATSADTAGNGRIDRPSDGRNRRSGGCGCLTASLWHGRAPNHMFQPIRHQAAQSSMAMTSR